MDTVSDIQDFQDDVAASWERLVGTQPPAPPAPPAASAEAPSTSLAVFDPIQAGLSELRQRYGNVAFDLRTVKGNDEARQARKALVSLRSRADDAYTTWNAPILEQQKAARAMRDSIKAEIQKIEAPIDEQIKADEARREAERRAKEEAEAARLAAIRARLGEIGSAAARVALGNAERIEAELKWLSDVELTEGAFAEFLSDAQALHAKAVADVEALLAARRERDAEAARLEQERRELEQRRQEEAARAAAERAELERKLAEERAQMAAERAELERQREETRLEREQMRLERERREEEASEAARVKLAAEQEAARALAKQGDIVDDTFEPQPEKAPPPAIAIVAAPPAPPAPPAPRQEDAFSAELESAVAQAADAVERSRPTDRELTLAIAERFGVQQSVAAIWLSHFDAIAEIDRCISEGA